MSTNIRCLCLVLAVAGALGACTHKIVSPDEPIRIEMSVLLKHEHVVRGDAAGG